MIRWWSFVCRKLHFHTIIGDWRVYMFWHFNPLTSCNVSFVTLNTNMCGLHCWPNIIPWFIKNCLLIDCTINEPQSNEDNLMSSTCIIYLVISMICSKIIRCSPNIVSHHWSHIKYPVLYHRNETKDVREIRLVSLWGLF